MLRTRGVTSGNAEEDSACRYGWLLGHFLDGENDPRTTADVEVKWAVYAGGERRVAWGVNDRAHTLAILVRGRFRLRFPEREVLLAREGDYVLWEPGVPHLWHAEAPAIVITVRWPSLPGDSRDMGEESIVDSGAEPCGLPSCRLTREFRLSTLHTAYTHEPGR